MCIRDRFHKECLGEYFSTVVASARYSCPQLRCAGPDCLARIPTQIWRDFVPDEVYMAYGANALAVMTLRCSGCDGQRSLFSHVDVSEDDKKESRKRLVECCGHHAEIVLSALQKYHSGEFDVEVMADILFESLLSDEQQAIYVEPLEEEIQDDHHPVIALMIPEEFDGAPAVIPSLLTDLERRAALQLECLRRMPFIRTPCCKETLCFKCKVMGHHCGETCADRMKEELRCGEVQCCPSCMVPTIKMEGCSEIVCVCGEVWEWEGGSDDY
eukprot:TRINITY_DN14942_c0_g1_i1.p1 TRINITY_DN14942_c0_g1~~TRINITY_DN14942_c0_g1_i1.p1  ORF type:complete len:271 (-),score=67.19 TRINITY_DN14942_c0_g1_i1:3-815(-)